MGDSSPTGEQAPRRADRDETTFTVPIGPLACEGCRDAVEARLRAHPQVRALTLDPEHQVARVTVPRGRATVDEIAGLVQEVCGQRNPVALPKPEVSSHAHVHTAHLADGDHSPAARAVAHAEHVGEMPPEHGSLPHGAHDMSDPRMAAAMEADMRRRFWISLILAIPVLLYSSLATNVLGLHLPTPFDIPRDWVMLVFATPIALWTSDVFHRGAYQAIRSGLLNMSVLVSLGILTAYLFSVGLTFLAPGEETFYEAAAMLAVFLLFGHWMEMKARRGSSDAVRKLLELAPQQTTIERDGRQVEVPVAEVAVGDVIVLKPGDKAPVDGVVLDGQSALDESMVTGESLPVEKGPGDAVLAGTLNQAGTLRFRATKVGADTALAQIVRLVELAQNSKAPAQRLADRAAHYLVLIAVGAGLLTFIVWLGVMRAPLLLALTFAVSAVVIACPDALGLATPITVMVATDLAAKRGILFKEAVALEQAARIDAAIFDKTGTLTVGTPTVTDVIPAEATEGVAANELLGLVGAIEARSRHPLARAVLDEAARRGVSVVASVSDFASLEGRGLRARVGGRAVLVGTRRLLEEQGIPLDGLAEVAERLQAEGKTLMLVAIDGRVAGLIAVADPVRPTARAAIAALAKLGIGAVMLTGDNRRTAEAVAREVGIDRVVADVLPSDKAEMVRQLQAEGKTVAMVGDGVNDAPALARADVGIAIGAGTDVAVETGDVVLMKSDPADVPTTIRIARATTRKMRENLAWAAGYNLIAIPVAAGLLYPSLGIVLPPEIGALAMSASSISVVANALLLRRAIPDA